jgi:glycosyltransferase involved in cell wall biosynthesis
VTSEQGDRPTISVLLPVHAGVDAAFLERALDSIAEQTLPADEVVVVEDGPLPVASVAVISRFEARGRPPLVRVVLESNAGPGAANGAGLLRCSGEWVAKADADDISLPTRFAEQLDCLRRSGADVCGTAMWEFSGAETNVVAVRRGPSDHESIARRMRINNPINHPTAVYRREMALEVGGYGDFRHAEDYDLFARMLVRGAGMVNTPRPLVMFRADDSMFDRRTGRDFVRLEWRLQRNLRSYGLIGTPRLVLNLVVRLGFRYLPRPLLRMAYRTFLARPSTGVVHD